MKSAIFLFAVLLFGNLVSADTGGTDSNGCRHIVVTNPPQSSYSAAQSQCNTRGGLLAVIKDQATQTFIYNHVPTGTSGYWIGGAYTASGQWIWDDGTIIPLPGQSGYHNWYTGSPSDSSNKRCLIMGGPQWYNAACNNEQALPYICQVADRNPCSFSPCSHRHQCRSFVCQYFCSSCVAGYYGDDCRYLNTKLISNNARTLKNNGLNLEFSCTFAGFPFPIITWIFNRTEINNDGVNYGITTTVNPQLDEIRQNLTIYQPRCIGTTTVTCRAHQNYTNVVNKILSIDPGLQLVQNFTASTDQCSVKKVYLSWTNYILLPLNLRPLIKYEISVRNSENSLVYQSPYENARLLEIGALRENTVYTIKLLARSVTCGEQVNMTSTATITTPYGIPLEPREATVKQGSLLSYTCSVQWKEPDSPPLDNITSFTIIEFGETINSRNVTLVRRTNESFNVEPHRSTGTTVYFYKTNLKPNTGYNFQIFATSCAGDGIRANATGLCQTDNAAPSEIPKPLFETESKIKIKFTIFKLNEERGLISCIFLVVGKAKEKQQQDINFISSIKELATSTEEYLALAISYTGYEISKSLGDNTTSSCTLYNQQQDPEMIQAINRPLIFNQTYSFYYITAVQARQGIKFSHSPEVTITTGTYAEETQIPSPVIITPTSIALISVLSGLLLVSVLVNIYHRYRLHERNLTAISRNLETDEREAVPQTSEQRYEYVNVHQPPKTQETSFCEKPIGFKSPYEYDE